MCGRFYVPEDASIQMIRAIVERLEHRNVKVKTGDVFPGDMAAVVASNRQMQPQPFAMEWGYHSQTENGSSMPEVKLPRRKSCLPMVFASAGA